MDVNNLRGKRIAFAASGGLDSCTITHWLAAQGVEVVCYSADLGQPDESSFDQVGKRMLESGAANFIAIDLKNEIAEIGLEVIQTNAKYEGNYWNMTGAARQVIVKGILPKMSEHNINIFSHGATGRGNDQVRFQVIAAMLNPNLSFYAAWRDEIFLSKFRGRKDMLDYCDKNRIPIKASHDEPYSTDANLLGLTHEGGALESLQTKMEFVKPGLGHWPQEAPEQSEILTISFTRGRPVKINGEEKDLVSTFEILNLIGGKHGVGIAENIVENRYVGVKSRGVYEAPAMVILAHCYQQLLQQVLDKRALQIYQQVSLYLGTQLYQGYWVDMGSRMARRCVQEISPFVNGDISVELYKGNIYYLSTENVINGLYNKEGSMEDEGNFDHHDSEGFLNILTLNAKTVALAKQIYNESNEI
ncbi:argininosuccinate synthase [Aeromonas enteropelogenes]|uniref:argininosuccinate synthase n=1 Tax=Aeromonas enteropelogenes TaxID=29489 RepID=UPI0038D17A69